MDKMTLADEIRNSRNIKWGELPDYPIKVMIKKKGRFDYYVKVTNGLSFMHESTLTLWGARRAAKKMAEHFREGKSEIIYKGPVEGLD